MAVLVTAITFIRATSITAEYIPLALPQAPCCRVDGFADGVSGYEKFHAPVPLPVGGLIVSGDWQRVVEAFGAD